MKGRGVTKSVKAIKFEGVWHELELKNVSRDNSSENVREEL